MKLDWFEVTMTVSVSAIAIGIAVFIATPKNEQRECSTSCGQYGKSMQSFSHEGNNVKCECGEAVK